MIQEISHVAFITHVEKDKIRSHTFLTQLHSCPEFDDTLSSKNRKKFYLTQDIEVYGRQWESIFLNKYYPNSWAESWLKYDLEMCNLKT